MKSRIVVLLIVALAAACGPIYSENSPNAGSITAVNQTDGLLLWVSGTSVGGLEEAFQKRTSWQTTPPGRSDRRATTASPDDPKWCEDPEWMHWALEPLDGQPFDVTDVVLRAEDFRIVAEMGPGACWGERHATWTVTS